MSSMSKTQDPTAHSEPTSCTHAAASFQPGMSSSADHSPPLAIPKRLSINTRPPTSPSRSSSLPFARMGQGHSRAPSPAPSPSASAVSVASRLKRAIVSRRKKSEDVSPLSGLGNKRDVPQDARQEQQFRHLRVDSCVPLTSLPSSKGRIPSNSSNPTLMMAADQLVPLSPPSAPPTPPPKPRPSNETSDNRTSLIPLSPGIANAVTLIYINEDKDRDQSMQGVKSKAREVDVGQDLPRLKPKEPETTHAAVADIKESWRKSDSAMSYHTIRPGTTSSRTSRPVSMAESLQSNHTIKPVRISALISDGDFTMLEEVDDTCKDPDAVDVPTPIIITSPQKGIPDASLKTKSRRSLSLNLGPYPSSKTRPPSPPTTAEYKYPSYSVTEGMPPPIPPPTPSAAKQLPKLVQTSAAAQTGPVPAPPPQSAQNLRGKLSSWTNPSPSERKLPPLPPQMHLLMSPSHPTPPPRAISMTSSLAPAAGRALRGAVGRMGRVMGISSSSSNSASASGYSSTTSDGQNLTRTNSNQSSAASHSYSMAWSRRRTPDAPSGSWSITSSLASTSMSDIDHLGVPSGPVLGPMFRAPFKGSSVVFGKDLRTAVRETAVGVGPPNAEGMRAGEWPRTAEMEKRAKMRDAHKALEERRLPAVVVRCAQHILVWGVEEEGLFR